MVAGRLGSLSHDMVDFSRFRRFRGENDLFRLQVNELLREVDCDDVVAAATTAIEQLTADLNNIKEDESVSRVPIPDSTSFIDFVFKKPISVQPIGSFAQGTMIHSGTPVIIDLAVVMPKECFVRSRDHLKSRYLVKKNLYLKRIQSQIDSQFTARGELDVAAGCTLRIHAVPEAGSIKMRPELSHSILSDIHCLELNKLVTDHLTDPLRQAIKLVKVWLKQRSIIGNGHLPSFSISVLFAYLIVKKKISKHETFELFKAFVKFIASISAFKCGSDKKNNDDHFLNIDPERFS